MALMLAVDGELPTQHAVAAASASQVRHRYSWRDAQHISRPPAYVLSAACSTGVSLIAGLGERLGLYGALRLRGTRAVVAPAWDTVADDVLIILDDVAARYLAGEGSLARCLRLASEQAGMSLARWRAWPLAIEGDWR